MWEQLRNRFGSNESFVSLVLGLGVVLLVGMVFFNYVKGKNQQPATSTVAQKTESQSVASLPTTHTVAAGETLWSISEKYFKSGYNWVDLVKANNLKNADMIEAGQTLTIPNVEPIVVKGQTESASVEVKTQETSYTVVHGDTLWSISVTHYGTGYRWPDVAKANQLVHPDIIHAGNVLKLP